MANSKNQDKISEIQNSKKENLILVKFFLNFLSAYFFGVILLHINLFFVNSRKFKLNYQLYNDTINLNLLKKSIFKQEIINKTFFKEELYFLQNF